MTFWFCMLLVNLMFPTIMLIEGWLFINKPPKRTNYIYGYRTSMSVKNEDTWFVAHATAGAFWVKWGKISLLPALLPHLLVIGQPTDVIGSVSAVVICLLIIPMLAVVPFTEKALKKIFDKNGNRKEAPEKRLL